MTAIASRGSQAGLAVRIAVVVGTAAAAALAARLSASDPRALLSLLAGAGVVALLLPRLVLTTAVLAGSFFYDDYFTETFGFWNPGKLLGLLALAALAFAVVRERRKIVWAPQVPIIVALGGVLAVSYTFARSTGLAMETGIRYALFFGLFFIVLQAVRTRRDVDLIIDVMVVAGTVAALIGLDNLFFHGSARVEGPLGDPGDFGLQLASVVPLLLYRLSVATGFRRVALATAFVVMAAATLGTFSRASLVGLAAGGAWALATGRLRVRWGVAAVAVVLMVAAGAYQYEPELIQSSLTQKENVAQANIDSRFGLWEVALDEWASSPIFGIGPGNFEVRFPEFRSPFHQRIETTHNAYLDVLSELGLAGLCLFLAYLAVSWRALRARPGRHGPPDVLRTALAASFLIALGGAMFMTQQFYPPLWFVPAVGAALASATDRGEEDPS